MTTSSARPNGVQRQSESASPVDIENPTDNESGNLRTVEVTDDVKLNGQVSIEPPLSLEEYAGIGRGLWGESDARLLDQIDADRNSWRR